MVTIDRFDCIYLVHLCVGCLVFCAVILNSTFYVHGLYCQRCDSISNARDCKTALKCSPNSTCYHDLMVASNGTVTRRLGCRDSNMTQPASVDPGFTVACSETCSTDLCSVKLCGDQDFASPHGPICFSCDSIPVTETWDQFEICKVGEKCDHLHPHIVGRRRRDSGNSCFGCCDGDLCNNNCSAQLNHAKTTGICDDHAPTVSGCRMAAPYVCKDRVKAAKAGCLKYCGLCPTASTTTIQQGCTDLTPAGTCKLTARLVCNDRTKAQNAHCLHYCGFC